MGVEIAVAVVAAGLAVLLAAVAWRTRSALELLLSAASVLLLAVAVVHRSDGDAALPEVLGAGIAGVIGTALLALGQLTERLLDAAPEEDGDDATGR